MILTLADGPLRIWMEMGKTGKLDPGYLSLVKTAMPYGEQIRMTGSIHIVSILNLRKFTGSVSSTINTMTGLE